MSQQAKWIYTHCNRHMTKMELNLLSCYIKYACESIQMFFIGNSIPVEIQFPLKKKKKLHVEYADHTGKNLTAITLCHTWYHVMPCLATSQSQNLRMQGVILRQTDSPSYPPIHPWQALLLSGSLCIFGPSYDAILALLPVSGRHSPHRLTLLGGVLLLSGSGGTFHFNCSQFRKHTEIAIPISLLCNSKIHI